MYLKYMNYLTLQNNIQTSYTIAAYTALIYDDLQIQDLENKCICLLRLP